MEKLAIGLLFFIACLSVLICALLRIIVELINKSNRQPKKAHVSIMCAALCGDYRNLDGDYSGMHGGRGGGGEFAYHHHYQQQQNLHQPPQTQYKQHHYHHHPPPPPPQQHKTEATPLPDDVRITFSDVRMTEYQNDMSELHNETTELDGRGSSDIGVGNNTRITFSDVRPDDDDDDEEKQQQAEKQAEATSRVRRNTVTAALGSSEGGGGAGFFKVPSRNSVRRKSSTPGLNTDTATSTTTTTTTKYTLGASNSDVLWNIKSPSKSSTGINSATSTNESGQCRDSDYGLETGVDTE
jgi:hypothetical protein